MTPAAPAAHQMTGNQRRPAGNRNQTAPLAANPSASAANPQASASRQNASMRARRRDAVDMRSLCIGGREGR